MKIKERERLLNADYKTCDIIELCWIHAKAIKEEEYEICARIVSHFKNRVLDDYDKLTLKRHLQYKDTTYQYLNELNGLLDHIKLTL